LLTILCCDRNYKISFRNMKAGFPEKDGTLRADLWICDDYLMMTNRLARRTGIAARFSSNGDIRI